MIPALELVDHDPDASLEQGIWQLWLIRDGWEAVCYLHADGRVTVAHLWVNGIFWPIQVAA